MNSKMITFIKDSFIPFYLFLVGRKILKDGPSDTFSVKICGDSFPGFSAFAIDACLHDLVDYGCIVSGDISFFRDGVSYMEAIETAGKGPFLHINHDTGIVLLYLSINSGKLEEYLDQHTEAWYNGKHQGGHQVNLIDPKIQVTRMITEFNSLIEKGYANDFIRYDFSSLLKRTPGDMVGFLYEMEQENQPFLSLWWLYKNGYLELDQEQLIQISDGDFFLFDGYMVISLKYVGQKIEDNTPTEEMISGFKITKDIFYDCRKHLFYNDKEKFSIKGKDIFIQIIENIINSSDNSLIPNVLVENNHLLKQDFAKGKTGKNSKGNKWSGYHEYLQSKSKNLMDQVFRRLRLNESENFRFLSCSKDLIAMRKLD